MLSSPVDESDEDWMKTKRDRDCWIYNQVMAGVKYAQIISELKSKPIRWSRIGSKMGIKKAAEKYAEDNNLPKPKPRPPGRPSA